MNRMVIVIGMLLLLMTAIGVRAGPEPLDAVGLRHEQMLYTVVLVRAGGGSGSGTVIYSEQRDEDVHSFILTNYHVIDDAIKIEEEYDPRKKKDIKIERRKPVDVEWFIYNNLSRQIGRRGQRTNIVAWDKERDLGLLRLVDTENVVPRVAAMLPEDSNIHLTDRVYAVGAGLGEPPFVTSGELAYLDKQMGTQRYMLSTAPIIFGNSGGALFRWSSERDRFELIGVPSKVSAAGFLIVSHMSWSIPMQMIREFLRDFCYAEIAGESEHGNNCSEFGEPAVKTDDN